MTFYVVRFQCTEPRTVKELGYINTTWNAHCSPRGCSVRRGRQRVCVQGCEIRDRYCIVSFWVKDVFPAPLGLLFHLATAPALFTTLQFFLSFHSLLSFLRVFLLCFHTNDLQYGTFYIYNVFNFTKPAPNEGYKYNSNIDLLISFKYTTQCMPQINFF